MTAKLTADLGPNIWRSNRVHNLPLCQPFLHISGRQNLRKACWQPHPDSPWSVRLSLIISLCSWTTLSCYGIALLIVVRTRVSIRADDCHGLNGNQVLDHRLIRARPSTLSHGRVFRRIAPRRGSRASRSHRTHFVNLDTNIQPGADP